MNRRWWLRLIVSLTLARPANGQHEVLLDPNDVVRLAEQSVLFDARYGTGGCPSATARLGPMQRTVSLRISDGCTDSVSSWAGDYSVDRRSGEVREYLSGVVVVDKASPILAQLWREVEESLLTTEEATCLVRQSDKVQLWTSLGIVPIFDPRPAGTMFHIDVQPREYNSLTPDRVLRFEVDRRQYSLYRGRFDEEDLSTHVLHARRLLALFKHQALISSEDIIESARTIPEISEWLSSASCRNMRLDEDTAGITYASVQLFKRCPSDSRSEGIASFVVDRLLGKIYAVQGLEIATRQLPGFASRLSRQEALRSTARSEFKALCQ